MRDKMMIGGCCVCSDERGWAENPLVYCDGQGCNVAVHQACYGIVTVPTGPWYCRKCESQERSGRLRCELCPSRDGALKRTDRSGWAHVVCALYIPEVRFGNVTTMEPILVGIIPPERFGKSCYICEQQGKEGKASIGACMQCNKSGCKQSFHVTCAQALGLLCEEAGNYLDNVKYCGYCQYHYSKLKKGGNVKTIPPYKPISGGNSSAESSPEKESPIEGKTLLRKRNKTVPTTTSSSTKSVVNSAPCAKLSALNTDNLRGEDGGDRSVNSGTLKAEKLSELNNGPTKFTTANFTETIVTESESVFGNGPTPSNDKPIEKTIKTRKSSSKQLASSPLNQPSENVSIDHTKSEVTEGTTVPESCLVPITTSTTSVQIDTSVSLSNSLLTNLTPATSNTSVSSALSSITTTTFTSVYENFFGNVNKCSNTPIVDGSSPIKRTSSIERRTKKPRRGGRKGNIGRPPKETIVKTDDPYSSPSSPSSVTESIIPAVSRKGRKRKTECQSLTAAHMLGNELNPSSSMAQHMTSTLNSEIEAHRLLNKDEEKESVDSQCESIPSRSTSAHNLDTLPVTSSSLMGPTYPGKNISTSRAAGPQPFPHSLEQLLERQWEQGSQFLMEQAQHFDIASLLSCLHQLRQENVRLEEHVTQLIQRRDHLLAVNARLSVPLNFHHSNNNLGVSSAAPFNSSPNVPHADHPRNKVANYLPMENGLLDHPKAPSVHGSTSQSLNTHVHSPLSTGTHGPSPQSFIPTGPPTPNCLPATVCPTTSSHLPPNHALPHHAPVSQSSVNLSAGMSMSAPGGYVSSSQSMYLSSHHPSYRPGSGSGVSYHGNASLAHLPTNSGSPSNVINSAPRSSITPNDIIRCNSVERPNSSLSQYSGYQMISPPLSLTSSSSGSGSITAQSIQRDLVTKCNASDKR